MNSNPSTHHLTRIEIARRIALRETELTQWFESKCQVAPPPFYCSVDIRDAGFKVSAVDCNLYPGGFNNLCDKDQRNATKVLERQLLRHSKRWGYPYPKKVLLIPESHTQNRFYLDNVWTLKRIFEGAGLEVRLGWIGKTLPEALLTTQNQRLEVLPIAQKNGVLSASGFVPDVIVLNNDFSEGQPEELQTVRQPIFPTFELGWHQRKKSRHFVHYNQLAREFAQILDLNPWTFTVDTEVAEPVDFNSGEGLNAVERAAEKVLEQTLQAYRANEIDRKPFVFIKNNAGTYGMGIMVIRDPSELQGLNRRVKNKMSVGKGKSPIRSVVIQEGVPTMTRVGGLASEPVIYLFGHELAGGFARTHEERSDEDNLNSPGVKFARLCVSDLERTVGEAVLSPSVFERVYGCVARLSAMATGLEYKELGLTQQSIARPI